MQIPRLKSLLGTNTSTDAGNVFALAWWSWCLLPPQHKAFALSPAFSAMKQLAPEPVWGLVTLLLLLGMLLTVHPRHYRTRAHILMGVAAFWGLVAAALFISNPHTPGVGVYAPFSYVTAWRAARLAGSG